MPSCKCEDVTFYGEDGHRCKRCFQEFVPKPFVDIPLTREDYYELFEESKTASQVVCWRNHSNITCGCPDCKRLRGK